MKIKDLFSKISGDKNQSEKESVVVTSSYDKMLICIALQFLAGANEEERQLIDNGQQPHGITGAIVAALDSEKIAALKLRFEESVGINFLKK